MYYITMFWIIRDESIQDGVFIIKLFSLFEVEQNVGGKP